MLIKKVFFVIVVTADTTGADLDESAQSILDTHCSRIWESSAGQTPSRSPGRYSPDRIAANRSLIATGSSSASFNMGSTSATKSFHHSKRGRDKDMNVSLPAGTSGGYQYDLPSHKQRSNSSIHYHHFDTAPSGAAVEQHVRRPPPIPPHRLGSLGHSATSSSSHHRDDTGRGRSRKQPKKPADTSFADPIVGADHSHRYVVLHISEKLETIYILLFIHGELPISMKVFFNISEEIFPWYYINS